MDHTATKNPISIFVDSFNPTGRFTRQQFFILFVDLTLIIPGLIVCALILLMVLFSSTSVVDSSGFVGQNLPWIYGVTSILSLYSGISRRLKDAGMSRWYLVCFLFPIVNFILLLLLMFRPSEVENIDVAPSRKFSTTESRSYDAAIISLKIVVFILIAASIFFFGFDAASLRSRSAASNSENAQIIISPTPTDECIPMSFTLTTLIGNEKCVIGKIYDRTKMENIYLFQTGSHMNDFALMSFDQPHPELQPGTQVEVVGTIEWQIGRPVIVIDRAKSITILPIK